MSNTSDRNKQIKVDVPRRVDGMVGVRATLRNMGIDNSQIGYNEANKTVTLGGREFMKPQYINENEGISYSMPSDIQKSVVKFYSNTNNPVVRVSDAYSRIAGQYGLSADALGYSNGTVTVGGRPLDVLYIDDDGKAWAFQDDVQASVDDYVRSLGVRSPNDLLEEYNSRYLPDIERLMGSIRNRREFSYDPETDPVYQAYRSRYLLDSSRAAQDTMASYAGLTGGYANSAAVTAAALAQQYYMSRLSDMIPQLAQQAYERYSDSYDNDFALLENMIGLYDTAYGNAYAANNRTISNANSAAASNVKRDNAAYERNNSDFERYWDELFNAQDYSWTERQNSQDYNWTEQQNSQDYNWTDVLNGQQSRLNELDIENSINENIMQSIYAGYYDSILKTQLEGERLTNRLTQERINQLLLKNALGM